MGLFSLAILKVFLFDFPLLGDLTRTIMLFVLGFLLLGFSILYPKLKTAASGRKRDT